MTAQKTCLTCASSRLLHSGPCAGALACVMKGQRVPVASCCLYHTPREAVS
jgi:hypothetical protein